MNNKKDIRWRQRFENFENAYALLEKYIDTKNPDELDRAGIIQFFEMAFELAWKLMKDYLESQDIKSRVRERRSNKRFKQKSWKMDRYGWTLLTTETLPFTPMTKARLLRWRSESGKRISPSYASSIIS